MPSLRDPQHSKNAHAPPSVPELVRLLRCDTQEYQDHQAKLAQANVPPVPPLPSTLVTGLPKPGKTSRRTQSLNNSNPVPGLVRSDTRRSEESSLSTKDRDHTDDPSRGIVLQPNTPESGHHDEGIADKQEPMKSASNAVSETCGLPSKHSKDDIASPRAVHPKAPRAETQSLHSKYLTDALAAPQPLKQDQPTHASCVSKTPPLPYLASINSYIPSSSSYPLSARSLLHSTPEPSSLTPESILRKKQNNNPNTTNTHTKPRSRSRGRTLHRSRRLKHVTSYESYESTSSVSLLSGPDIDPTLSAIIYPIEQPSTSAPRRIRRTKSVDSLRRRWNAHELQSRADVGASAYKGGNGKAKAKANTNNDGVDDGVIIDGNMKTSSSLSVPQLESHSTPSRTSRFNERLDLDGPSAYQSQNSSSSSNPLKANGEAAGNGAGGAGAGNSGVVGVAGGDGVGETSVQEGERVGKTTLWKCWRRIRAVKKKVFLRVKAVARMTKGWR